MISNLFTTTTSEFFKAIALEITKVTNWQPELYVQKHSSVDVTYLGKFAFKDKDNTIRYLNLICLDKNSIFLVNKYYKKNDWAYLSDETRMEWKGATRLFPIDEYMFSVTDINTITTEELIKHVSLNKKFENINSAEPVTKNVFSCIDSYFSIKQQQEAILNQIQKYQKQLEELRKENIVTKVIIPIATQCKEILGYDSYRLTKSESANGLRVNIILEKEGAEKKLAVLLKEDYPLEITGINENKTYQTAQLPSSFKELATHFR